MNRRVMEKPARGRRITGKGLSSLALLLAGLLLAVGRDALAQDGSLVAQGRDKFEAFESEISAGIKAQTESNMDAARSHQTRAAQYLQDARSFFDRAQAGKSEDPDILKDYADLLIVMGDADLASEVLQRRAELTPHDAEAWFALGRVLASRDRAYEAEAAAALRRALTLDSANTEAASIYSELGRLYWRGGLFDLAERSYSKALAASQSDVSATIGLAALAIRKGKLAEASAQLDVLGALTPDKAGMLERMVGESLADFEQSPRWFADTAQNHMAYAKLLIRLNRLPQSVMPLERALELDPDNYVDWNLMGSVMRGLGDLKQARRAFTKSLELNPDQPRTREVLEKLGEEEEKSEQDQPNAPGPPA